MSKLLAFLKKKEVLIVFFIFLLALALRCVFLNYGLPGLYLEDEEFFVRPALNIANGWSMNPGWFGAPAQPLIYALSFSFRFLNFIFNQLANTHLPADQNYAAHLAVFQTVGRIIPALCGALVVILVYLLGARWSKRAGYLASFLAATSFYLVEQSHIIRPDIIQVLFLFLTLYFIFRIIENPQKLLWYILVGGAFGLAVNSKYPSLFFIPAILLVAAWLIYQKSFKLKKWIIFVFSALAVSFLTGPFLYLRFQKVLKDVAIENRSRHGGHEALGLFGNLKWYFLDVFPWQLGTFIMIIAAAVIIYFVVRLFLKKKISAREFQIELIIFAALSYLLIISGLHLHWERWVIPSSVLSLVLAGVGLDFLIKIFWRNKVLVCLILLVVLIAPLFRLARTVYSFSSTYTVEKTKLWVLENISAKTKLVVEPYAPPLPADQYKQIKLPNASWYSVARFKKEKVDYFIITEKVYGVIKDEFARGNPDKNYGKAMAGYDKLFASSDLVFNQKPNPEYTKKELLYSPDWDVLETSRIDLLYGPEVWVYKIR